MHHSTRPHILIVFILRRLLLNLVFRHWGVKLWRNLFSWRGGTWIRMEIMILRTTSKGGWLCFKGFESRVSSLGQIIIIYSLIIHLSHRSTTMVYGKGINLLMRCMDWWKPLILMISLMALTFNFSFEACESSNFSPLLYQWVFINF